MSELFEESLKSGVHFELARLEGDWEGTSRVWFWPELVDESPIQGNMRLVLGGRFVMHGYRSSYKDKPLEGLALYGYHLGLGVFQGAWIDSFHNGTAMMFSEGPRNSPTLDMTGSYYYVTPETEQKWSWRTKFDIVDENNLTITAYNISPEGEEVKATEIVYKRIK